MVGVLRGGDLLGLDALREPAGEAFQCCRIVAAIAPECLERLQRFVAFIEGFVCLRSRDESGGGFLDEDHVAVLVCIR